MIKCAYENLLEAGEVTLSEGAEDSSRPLYRLYDRGVGRTFRAASAGTLEIKISLDDPPPRADRLIIAEGHNLDGASIEVLCSDDDASYSPAVAEWEQSGGGLINVAWAPLEKRYWKLRITEAPSAPEMAEVFLTSTYEWERNPSRPAGPFDPVLSAEHDETAGGSDRFLVHGPSRRQRRYSVPYCTEQQRDSMAALYGEWGGSKPLWLEDHDGEWIYGRLQRPLDLRETSHGSYSFEFDFMEVLP